MEILALVLSTFIFIRVVLAMYSLSTMGLTGHSRHSKISMAAMRVRRIVTLKGGLRGLAETDLLEIAAGERDLEVIHYAREILRIVSSPSYRLLVRDNEIHYRLFHRLPWDILYGPEKCPLCECEINDLGYCCCSGVAD